MTSPRKSTTNASARPKLQFEPLEPRILYSADAALLLAATGGDTVAEVRVVPPVAAAPASAAGQTATATATATQREIVFVDSRVPDATRVVDDLVRQRGAGRQLEVIMLHADEDGVAQIDRVLHSEHGLSAVHIISHGSAGRIQIGATTLDAAELRADRARIAEWGQALSDDGDLLLYGCDVAAGEGGRAFVQALADLTQADVAASTNATGARALGGNWQLEFSVGQVTTHLAPSAQLQRDWAGVLDITSGLVANWRFDHNANDFSGNNLGGVLTNGAAIDNAVISNKVGGGKLTMDGVNDYVELSAQAANFTGLTQGTITAWIKTSDTQGVIFALTDVADSSSYSVLGVQGGKLNFVVYENNVGLINVASIASINDNAWHHVAVTAGAAGNNLYIDGTLASVSRSVGSAANTEFFSAVTGVDFVGIGENVTNIGAGSFLAGLVDDVRVYNRALSGADITQLVGFVAPNISVSRTAGLLTTEAGGSASFEVVLTRAPIANVTIGISSSDTTEGTVSASSLIFTSANWGTAQTVTVTGVNDAFLDGFQGYTIVTGAAASGDGSYNGYNAADVQAANADDDITFGQITVDTANDVADGDTASLSALAANRGADGFVSLREAITAANNTANGSAADVINFNIIGGGVQTINLGAVALPIIDDAVFINGNSAVGFGGVPLVAIDGNNLAVDGLRLYAGSSGSTIRGLVINRFTQDGIDIANSSGNTVVGNWIGLTVAGNAAAGGVNGVNIFNGNNNLIGGTAAAERNVIAGNSYAGVWIGGSSTGNLVRGNYLGTTVTGTTGVASAGSGVAIFSANNTVGATAAGAGNVISGHAQYGVSMQTSTATGNSVAGNLIGLTAGGNALLGNGNDGVFIIDGASNNTVGGSTVAARNVIAGNSDGVQIGGVSGGANNNLVQGNYIGTDITGTLDFGNNDDGVDVDHAVDGNQIIGNLIAGSSSDGIDLGDALATTGTVVQGNLIGTAANGTSALGNAGHGILIGNGGTANGTRIGGTLAGQGNTIAFNALDGIYVAASTSVTVLGNQVFGNGGLAIDLGPDGVTANDAGDADTGPNNLQNFAVLTSARTDGAGQLIVAGSLNSSASSYYRIELYANTTQDASGYGEGSRYLGFANLSTNAAGNAVISATLGASVAVGEFISATATKTDAAFAVFTDTSEFARNVAAVSTVQAAIVVDTTADNIDGDTTSLSTLLANKGVDGFVSLREAITAANNTANGSGGADLINFNIAGGGVRTINIGAVALPSITNGVIIDGWSQPGFGSTPLIELNGNNAGTNLNGLTLAAGSSGSTVLGLTINRFTGHGIEITSSVNTTVAGNWIGLNNTGTAAAANARDGIYASASVGLRIGGGTAQERNLIAGNGEKGIEFDGVTNSTIAGNYIGTDVTGTLDVNGAVANVNQSGVLLVNNSNNNLIGGLTAGARNLISGNNHYGFEVQLGSQNNLLQGNYIGTTVTGQAALGNFEGGTAFWNAGTGNVFGGSAVGARNIISGNGGRGIYIGFASNGATVQGNYIGLAADGITALGNNQAGIRVDGNSTATLIGTNADGNNDAAERNVISANGTHGVLLWGDGGTTIAGNYIGTNAAGTAAVGNTLNGVAIYGGSTNNRVGGAAAGAGNVISGNLDDGIAIADAGTNSNQIQGNAIGLNAARTGLLGNGSTGIWVGSGASNNTIGGTVAGAGNLIGGSLYGAVEFNGVGTSGNALWGNTLGTDTTLTALFGNGTGVDVAAGASNNRIGGTLAGEGNVIANNRFEGVKIDGVATVGNPVLGNRIFGNGQLGIDLVGNGVTPNDGGTDADNGPNGLQNFPILTNAQLNAAGQLTITGVLNSKANQQYRIEFFSSPTTDGSGHGEGRTFLASLNVATDASGNAAFYTPLGLVVPAGSFISATATQSNAAFTVFTDTSEFSQNRMVLTPPTNSVPAAQSTAEDTDRMFSVANGNAITITDADAGGANNQVALSISNGTLTLATTAGLTFTAGDGINDGYTVMRGTAAAINNALDGLRFSPTLNFNGIATLTLATQDAVLLSLDIDTALVGRYAFDVAGSLGTDSGPAFNNGTAVGVTSVTDAQRGLVLGLGGAGYVQVNTMYGNPANVTLAAWVNLTVADTTGSDVISLGDNFVLRVDETARLVGVFKNSVSGTFTPTDYAVTLAGTGWHHVAYSFNDALNIATLYLDGVQVASTSTAASIAYNEGTATHIGRHGNGQTAFDFTGRIDDARIYNRALTAAEIATLAVDQLSYATDSVAITVTAVNDAAVVVTTSGAQTYTENAAPTAVDNALLVTDIDSTTLAAATVTISANYANGQDTLAFVNQNGITGSWNAATGTLSLSGTATPANYQTALRSVTFANNSDAPSTLSRTVSFTVDDGTAQSTPATRDINLTAVNDAPVLTTGGLLVTQNEDVFSDAGALVSVLSNPATDADSGALKGIAITAIDNSHGTWQYALDGSTWQAVGPVSATSARLLAGDATTRLRFVPNADWNGDVTANSFRAWDQTSGVAGGLGNASVNGGSTAFSIGQPSFIARVVGVNDAPVALAFTTNLAAVDEDTGNPPGASVASLFGSAFSDATDAVSGGSLADAFAGVAVVGNAAGTAQGAWQWFGGAGWTAVGTAVANGNALLLAPGTLLRFVPAADFNGTPGGLTVRLVDSSAGSVSAGASANVGAGGSTTRYSDAANIVLLGTSINPVNDAPTTTLVTLAPVAENSGARLITQAELLVNASDVDGPSLSATSLIIASGLGSVVDNGNGTWSYTPALNDDTEVVFNLVISDGSLTAAATATLDITPVNNAPTLYAAATFNDQFEDVLNDAGTLVSVFANLSNDADSGALKGIAVTQVDNTLGSWQYTLDGSSWLALGTVSNSSARLLPGDATARIRFVPNADFNGQTGTTLFRAWDRTSGAAGGLADVSVNGGASAFSVGVSGSTMQVLGVYDAPTALSNNTTLAAVAENTANPPGATIDTLFGATFSDAADEVVGGTGGTHAQAFAGVAITNNSANAATDGQWQWFNGTAWADVGVSVSSSSALTLTPTTLLRFVPNANFNGAPGGLTVRLIDSAYGPVTSGALVNVGVGGGTTQYSNVANQVVLATSITAVNDKPVVGTTSAVLVFTENDAATAVDSGLTVTDTDNTTLAGASVSIAVNFVVGEDSLVFTDQNGISGSWNAVGGVLTLSGTASVADYQTALRSVAYANPSNNPNVGSRAVSFVVNDGLSNSTPAGRNIAVTAVNDAPLSGPVTLAAIAENSGMRLITQAELLANASDVDGPGLSATSLTIASGLGSVVDNGNGTWNYTPAFNDATAVAFSYVVTDGSLTAAGNAAMDITPVNSAPVLTMPGAVALAYTENDAATVVSNTLTITDADSTSLVGATASVVFTYQTGQDVLAFTNQFGITGAWDAGTGVLTLSGTATIAQYQAALRSVTYLNSSDNPSAAPREVSFVVNDGVDGSAGLGLSVNLTAVNDAPMITSNGGAAVATVTVDEAQTGATTVTSTDVDGGTPGYSLVGGADQARFSIDAASGVLTFLVAPIFSAPTDANADNIYQVTVQASDGNGGVDTQAIDVRVTPVGGNTAPVITSNGGGATAAISLNENLTAVTTVVATDADLPAQTLTYAITGGTDAARFAINANTGALTFVVAPDYEAPTDANGDNIYNLVITVSDGALTDNQMIDVTVADVSNALVVTTTADTNDTGLGNSFTAEQLNASRGADGLVSLREAIIAANTTAGANSIGFNIAAPLVGGAHTIVLAGALPTITYTVVINGRTDPDALTGPVVVLDGSAAGAGVSGLVLNAGSSGSTLRGLVINGFSAHGIAIQAGSSGNLIAGNYLGTDVTGTLARANGTNGVSPAIEVNSNNNLIGGSAAADRNLVSGNQSTGIWINGSANTVSGNTIGTDVTGTAALGNVFAGVGFALSAGGNLIGGTAAGSGNLIAHTSGGAGVMVYSATATGNAMLGNTLVGNTGLGIDLLESATLGVTANDLGDADSGANDLQNFPVLSSAVVSGGNTTISGSLNSTANTNLRIEFFSILGGTTNASGHGEAQAFIGFVDVLTDAAGNASFSKVLNGVALPLTDSVTATATVHVGATFGSTSEFALNVAVTTPAANAPVNTVPGAQAALQDTALAIAGVSVADADGDLATAQLTVLNGRVTVNLAGGASINGGSNGSAMFTLAGTQAQINAALATLSYLGNTGYTGSDTLTVRSTDALGGTDSDAVNITLSSAANSAPVITSNGAGAAASVNVLTGTSAVTTVTSTDVDVADTATYSISGGADSLRFAINASTGALSFITAPDVLLPLDAGGNNVYDVAVQVADGAGGIDTQALAVTVTAVVTNAPAVLAVNAGTTVAANSSGNLIGASELRTTDADNTTAQLVYTVTAATANGVLRQGALVLAVGSTFTQADIDAGRLRYDQTAAAASADSFSFSVDDGSGNPSVGTFAIAITPLAQTAPVFAGGATARLVVAENTTAVTTVRAADPTAPNAAMTYRIAGGADAARFVIDAASGALRFAVAADFEAPADASRANRYEVIVEARAAGGGPAAQQSIAVSVTDVNEQPSGRSGTVTTDEDTPRNFSAADFGFTDADAGDRLGSVRIDAIGGAGALTIDGAAIAPGQRLAAADVARLVFTPRTDANGAAYATLAFTVADAGGLSAAESNQLQIDVTAVNDRPLLTAAQLTVEAGYFVSVGAAQFGAADIDTPLADVWFVVSEVRAGRFELAGQSGVAVTQFSQADLSAGRVRFVSLSYQNRPSFRVAAYDGKAFSDVQDAAVVVTPSALIDGGGGDTGPRGGGGGGGGGKDVPVRSAEPVASGTPPATASATPAATPAAAGGSVPALDAGTAGDGLGKPTTSAVGGSLTNLSPMRTSATPTTLASEAVSSPWRRVYAAESRPQPARTNAPVAVPNAFGDAVDGFASAWHTTRAWLQFGVDQLAVRVELHADAANDYGTVQYPDAAPQTNELLGAPAVRITSTVLGAGTVWWALRAGGLMTSLLVVLPTWRHVDLLAVLPDRDDDEDDWDRDGGPHSTTNADEFDIDEHAVQQVLEPTADRSTP